MDWKRATTDDAGRPAAVINARETAESKDPELRELVRRAIEVHRNGEHARTVAICTGLLISCGIAGLLIALALGLKDPWPQVIALVCVSACLIPVVGHLKSGVARVLKDELVRAGRCGSCAYPIHDLSERSGELVVCPECASSWRCSRFTNLTAKISGPSAPMTARPPAGSSSRAFVRDLDAKRLPAPDPYLPGAEEWLGIFAGSTRESLRQRLWARRMLRTILVVGLSIMTLTLAFALVLMSDPTLISTRPDDLMRLMFIATVFILGCMWAVGLQLRRVWTGRTTGQRVATMKLLLRAGLCASCAHRLTVASDGQSYMPCGSCGGRWPRVDDPQDKISAAHS